MERDGKTAPKGGGQAAYERRRAEAAGMSLEAWLASKEKRRAADAASVAAAAKRDAAADKRPGLLTRLLDRAHRPLKSKG